VSTWISPIALHGQVLGDWHIPKTNAVDKFAAVTRNCAEVSAVVHCPRDASRLDRRDAGYGSSVTLNVYGNEYDYDEQGGET